MVVVVMRTISTKPDKSINFKTRRKSRVLTERKIILPPRRNPWRWFNESAMSIAPIHKAKENEHKYTWSSVDFLTPRSSNNQAAITPEFCLSPPKEPKAWHQPPHPALWGLSNISSNTFFITSNLYKAYVHINPGAVCRNGESNSGYWSSVCAALTPR